MPEPGAQPRPRILLAGLVQSGVRALDRPPILRRVPRGGAAATAPSPAPAKRRFPGLFDPSFWTLAVTGIVTGQVGFADMVFVLGYVVWSYLRPVGMARSASVGLAELWFLPLRSPRPEPIRQQSQVAVSVWGFVLRALTLPGGSCNGKATAPISLSTVRGLLAARLFPWGTVCPSPADLRRQRRFPPPESPSSGPAGCEVL